MYVGVYEGRPGITLLLAPTIGRNLAISLVMFNMRFQIRSSERSNHVQIKVLIINPRLILSSRRRPRGESRRRQGRSGSNGP